MPAQVNRRNFLATVAQGAAALAGPRIPFAASAAENRPNIILCMCDDLGWGDVGFNGNKIIKTPNLDQLAAQGIRFVRFHSGGPVCSPTRGTCLTGRHYFRYGITHANEGYLPVEEITVAELCKSLGYTTGHFGKWHLGTLTTKIQDGRRGRPGNEQEYSPPWKHGFDVSFSTEQAVPTWDPMKDQPFLTKYWTAEDTYATENLEGDDSRVLMDRVVPFIRAAAKARQPFLAVVWFHTPHAPVVAGPQYRAMYSQYSEGEQHYYGAITAMDEQVGRMCRELRELGVADKTMLWFASDNGPEGRTADAGRNRGSTGGLRGRKRSLFCGGVTVPGLLVWPGRARPGRVVETPCNTLDYFPTLMEVLGWKWPKKARPLDGISLLPLIEEKQSERPVPIPFRYIQGEQAMFGSPTMAMEENQYKLLTNFSDDGHEDMLFDLRRDPYEKNNIVSEKPEIARDMKVRLRAWLESCRKSYEGADYDGPYTPAGKFLVPTGSWPSEGGKGRRKNNKGTNSEEDE